MRNVVMLVLNWISHIIMAIFSFCLPAYKCRHNDPKTAANINKRYHVMVFIYENTKKSVFAQFFNHINHHKYSYREIVIGDIRLSEPISLNKNILLQKKYS